MKTPWLALAAIVTLALAYVIVPIMVDAMLRFRRKRMVGCSETGLLAEIGLDAPRAALTAVPGPSRLRVVSCSLWPERRGCEQRCVAHGHVA